MELRERLHLEPGSPLLLLDTDRAALLWAPDGSLSLADRLCLAAGERLAATVWMADRKWGSEGRVRQVR